MTTVDRPGVGGVELRPVDRDLFCALLHRQASTVTVVTVPGVAADRRLPALPPGGFITTSFTSVSLEPPLVSFRLGRESSSWPTAERAEHLAVHLLTAGQQDVARAFPADGINRFASHEGWTRGPFGVPLIDDAPAVLLCRVVRRIEAGDQTTVLAEPLALGGVADADPLVHHAGDRTTTFGPWPSPW